MVESKFSFKLDFQNGQFVSLAYVPNSRPVVHTHPVDFGGCCCCSCYRG